MVNRKELLKNVRNYSPQDIADAIRSGVVSLYDLSKETDGAFTPLLKREVKRILNTPVPERMDTAEMEAPTTDTSQSTDNPAAVDSEISIPNIDTSPIPVLSFDAPVVDNVICDEDAKEQSEYNTQTASKKPSMFSHIFSFNGRIRRTEYGLTYLAYWLWNIPMEVLSEQQISVVYAIVYLVTLFPLFWILIAQGAKRCHDRGNSGWYQMIPFYFFWMIFAEGEADSNEYGDSPK